MDLEKPKRKRRVQSDDEEQFWRQWPNAPKYWDARERAMTIAYIPSWYPGVNINSICMENKQRNPAWREPLWFEWPNLRAAWPAIVYLPSLESLMPWMVPAAAEAATKAPTEPEPQPRG